MRNHLLAAVVILLVLITRIDASFAQAANDGESYPSQIIVTAQKRAENVNSIPAVISVLTNQDLVQGGIDSTEEIELAVPGLVFGNTNGFAQPYIRGIGTTLIAPGQDSPVGFYLDGVYLPFSPSLLQEFGDIERIEVLKGPQGTLYGRNTTAGAVNIITREPQQTFAVDTSISGGNLGYAKAVTYMTGGLTDNLSANVSGVYTIHNGFFDVLNTGARLDNLDQFGLRSKLKYEINDQWDVVLGGDYLHKNDSSDTVYTALVGSDNALPSGVGPAYRARDTYTELNPPPHRTATDWGANLTAHGRMGWADFTAISGFREDYQVSSSDGDGTSLSLVAYQAYEGEQQFTQELQWASTASTPIQWVGGLYFLKANAFYGPVNVWSNVPISDPVNAASLDGRTRISSYAGYGQASYQLPYGLKVVAGFRTSYEQRTLTGQTDFTTDLFQATVRAALGLPPLQPSKSWTTTKPKATLQWEIPGQLLYASYSTAFKAGSYNLISTTSPGPLGPENIKSYELGGKHELPSLLHAQLDWAVFYYDYSNIQVSVQDPGTGGINASQNAASSINRGVDLDLTIPIAQNLTASVGMEYLDARYKSYTDAQVPNIVNGVLASTSPVGYTKSVDASGNRMERAPLLTSTVRVQWLLPVSTGDVSTTVTYYHNSGFYFDAGNELQQKAYNLANLSIEYAPRGNHWSVSAWINNAFNATIISGTAPSPDVVSAFYANPRLFGLSASAHY